MSGQFVLVRRQLFRNRRRTALTLLGLAVSFFLYTSLETVLETLEGIVERTASDTIVFARPRHEVSFVSAGLPRRYIGEVREVDGVTAATPLRFVFARGRSEDSLVMAIAAEFEPYLGIHRPPSLSGPELDRMRATKDGAVLGEEVLIANRWKVGDRITLSNLAGPETMDLEIVGDTDRDDRWGGVAVVHLDYLEKVFGGAGRATFLQARVTRPEIAAAVGRAIDTRFERAAVPTETTTEKAHMGSVVASLADVLDALGAIGSLTLLVTLLVVTNAVAMGVRERTVEIGVLRALGFGRARVVGLVLAEAVMVSVAGGAVGAAAAYSLFASGLVEIPIGEGIPLDVDPTVLLRAALLAVPLGALAGLQPAWSAVRVPITEALGHVD